MLWKAQINLQLQEKQKALFIDRHSIAVQLLQRLDSQLENFHTNLTEI
jgi:hypothetical protein